MRYKHVQRVRLCWFGGLGRHELANIKPRSLRLPCGQRLFADRIASLGMEEFVDEKFGLVEGLTTNVLPFRKNPVRTTPLQTQSYPGTRSTPVRGRTFCRFLDIGRIFVIGCLLREKRVSFQFASFVSPFSVNDATNEIH